MRYDRVWEIFRKDSEELRSNRWVFASLFLIPVIFALEATFLVIQAAAAANTSPAPISTFLPRASVGLDLLLLIPSITAVTIGATSIVQEKTTRSLEPLLATPITDSELLWGKALLPFVPGLIAVWACYLAVFIVGDILIYPIAGVIALPTTLALYEMFLAAPLLGLLGTFAVLVVSSWAKDPRAAQQLTTVAVLPILIAVLIVFVVLPENWELLAAFTAGVAIVDFTLFRFAVRRFDRPSILVSWR
ncbi:MAG: ABC transporter permease subunit [Thermoplasmata archaeon]